MKFFEDEVDGEVILNNLPDGAVMYLQTDEPIDIAWGWNKPGQPFQVTTQTVNPPGDEISVVFPTLKIFGNTWVRISRGC